MTKFEIVKASPSFIAGVKAQKEAAKTRFEKHFASINPATTEKLRQMRADDLKRKEPERTFKPPSRHLG